MFCTYKSSAIVLGLWLFCIRLLVFSSNIYINQDYLMLNIRNGQLSYNFVITFITGFLALLDLWMIYGAIKNVKAALITWEIFATWNVVINFYNCYNESHIKDLNFGAGIVFIIFQILTIFLVNETIKEINSKKTKKNSEDHTTPTSIYIIPQSNNTKNWKNTAQFDLKHWLNRESLLKY